MATAKEERELFAKGKGILATAPDNEPIFILRGQDLTADEHIDRWAIGASLLGCPNDKVREAKALAQAMREWPNRKNPD